MIDKEKDYNKYITKKIADFMDEIRKDVDERFEIEREQSLLRNPEHFHMMNKYVGKLTTLHQMKESGMFRTLIRTIIFETELMDPEKIGILYEILHDFTSKSLSIENPLMSDRGNSVKITKFKVTSDGIRPVRDGE